MKAKSCIFLLTLAFISCVADTQEKNLTIHLVPYSHDGADKVQSFEEYYQNSAKQILTNVMNLLEINRDKIFNWADIAIFERWWTDQNPEMKNLARLLVKKQRFVFIGGGWIMNDEALPSYKEMLLQMRLGLDFLQDNFGVRPNIAWQIDPFGSSAVTVAVLHKLGYDGFVGNRMSQIFKDKMAEEDGFNFYWQGHQVSKDPEDTILFTHILQPLSTTWNEHSLLSSPLSNTTNSLYTHPLIPSPQSTSQNRPSQNSVTTHTVLPTGNNFQYKEAGRFFTKLDELKQEIVKRGKKDGWDLKIEYDTMCGYFAGLDEMKAAYGVFKGDFLQYQGELLRAEDSLARHYSSRLHFKGMIRHVFNEIQSTKTLLAIRALSHERKIRFSGPFSFNVDKVNQKIAEAEKKWAILKHKNVISEAHSSQIELIYYKTLQDALNHLDSARKIINKSITYRPSYSRLVRDQMQAIIRSLENPQILHYSFVNPSGYFRIQLQNVTVPIPETETYYILYAQVKDGLIPITSVFYADIHELFKSPTPQMQKDKSRSDSPVFEPKMARLIKTRKLFFKLPLDALSEKQIFVFTTSNKEACMKFQRCAKKILPSIENRPIQLSTRLDNFSERITEEVTESIIYRYTDGSTKIMEPLEQKIYRYELPGMLDLLQVYSYTSEDRLLKTYIINQDGCPHLMKQLFMEVQFETKREAEVSLKLKKKNKSNDSTHKSYADDSMKLIERPIFDKQDQTSQSNPPEPEESITYPCVHGGIMREIYKETSKNHTKESFFGWVNSVPMGCTFSDKNEVSLVIFSNIEKSKTSGGINHFTGRYIPSISFQFYFEKSVKGALFQKARANTKINEPYGVFSQNIYQSQLDAIPFSSSLAADFLKFNDQVQVSQQFGEVDIADLKLMRHKILEGYNDYELAIVLRNRYNGYVPIMRNSDEEGLFKNEFIDTLKSHSKASQRSNFNKTKKILGEEIYDLASLEDDFDQRNSTKPKGFHGLEPFEMAEFRIVRSSTLEALELKKKEIESNVEATGKRINCNTFKYLSLNHKVVNYFHKYFRSIMFVLGILVFICMIFLIKRIRNNRKKKRDAAKRHIRVSDLSFSGA